MAKKISKVILIISTLIFILGVVFIFSLPIFWQKIITNSPYLKNCQNSYGSFNCQVFINNYQGQISSSFYQDRRIFKLNFSLDNFLKGELDLFYNLSFTLKGRLNQELEFNNLKIKPLDFELYNELLKKQGELNLKSSGINFYPPFKLRANFDYQKSETKKQKLNFPLSFIINNDISTKFSLNAEGVLVSGIILEKINNQLQLSTLASQIGRKVLFDGSYISIYSQNLEKRENLVPLYYFLGLDFNSSDKELRESITIQNGELIYKAELPNPNKQKILPTVIQ